MPTTRINHLDFGGGYTVQIDAGADNSIVVMGNMSSGYLERIDANNVITVLANAPAFAGFYNGAIDTLSDGRYVLGATWHSGLGADARVQIVGRNGTPATALIDPAFEDGAGHGYNGWQLTATNNGGFFFGWDDTSRSSDPTPMTYPGGSYTPYADRDVRVRFFDHNAAATTPSYVADDDVESVNGTTVSRRASAQYGNDAATLAGGQTVFVYEDTRWVTNATNNGAQQELVLSMQIAVPGNVGEPIQVDLGTFGDQFGQYPNSIERLTLANVVPLDDGNFAVLWTERVYEPAAVWGNYSAAGWNTMIRYFDPSGNALTDPQVAVFHAEANSNISKAVYAEALSDGRIAVAYSTGIYGVNGNGLTDAYLSIIGAYGSGIETSRINQAAAVNGQSYTVYDVAVRSDDTIEVVYNDAHAVNGGNLNHTVTDRFTTGAGTPWNGGGYTMIGNGEYNPLSGGDGDDILSGLGAGDNLSGGAGNDRLNGGTGADAMYGGTGNDTFVVDHVYDQTNESVNAGTDTVESSVSWMLSDNVENLRLTGSEALNGTGNALVNALTGNSNANILDGRGGADLMQGGKGDDIYYVDNVGDKVVELDGQGSEIVRSTVSFSLAGQFTEVLELIGAAAINGTGNGLANRIIGSDAANFLNGGDGNDRLDGGLGADTMRGGLGNDTFVVDNAGDVIQENNGEGTDTVEASISYSLAGQYVETLTLTGSANLNGTGNNQANTLNGNSGNNTLNGMGGADSMRGGAGDDRYIVDSSTDAVVELNGEGNDIVESSASFSLAGQYIETLMLTGTAAINGTGNSLANTIWGNSAANLLRGDAGNDALHGGLGKDTLTGGAGGDHFWFETTPSATNFDTITDFNVADDTIDLDRSVSTGIGADGVLASGAFRAGTVALDADDRILYDAATGNIWYDADGAGGAAATLFAKVTAGLALTSADFLGQP